MGYYKESDVVYRVKRKFAFDGTVVRPKRGTNSQFAYIEILFKFYYIVEYRKRVNFENNKWRILNSASDHKFLSEVDAYDVIEKMYQIHNQQFKNN